jgi:hypothetical protein
MFLAPGKRYSLLSQLFPTYPIREGIPDFLLEELSQSKDPFRPECCSESQGNRVRLQSGIAFTFDRIPHIDRYARRPLGHARTIAGFIYASGRRFTTNPFSLTPRALFSPTLGAATNFRQKWPVPLWQRSTSGTAAVGDGKSTMPVECDSRR